MAENADPGAGHAAGICAECGGPKPAKMPGMCGECRDLREKVARALYGSLDLCAGCKVCEHQVAAVLAAVRIQP